MDNKMYFLNQPIELEGTKTIEYILIDSYMLMNSEIVETVEYMIYNYQKPLYYYNGDAISYLIFLPFIDKVLIDRVKNIEFYIMDNNGYKDIYQYNGNTLKDLVSMAMQINWSDEKYNILPNKP